MAKRSRKGRDFRYLYAANSGRLQKYKEEEMWREKVPPKVVDNLVTIAVICIYLGIPVTIIMGGVVALGKVIHFRLPIPFWPFPIVVAAGFLASLLVFIINPDAWPFPSEPYHRYQYPLKNQDHQESV